MAELASSAITAVDTVTIELGEADETPAIVNRQMACQGNRLSPASFPPGADTAALRLRRRRSVGAPCGLGTMCLIRPVAASRLRWRPELERSGRTAGCGTCREGPTASPQVSRPTARRLSALRCRTQDVYWGALPSQSA
jgi:hypothetical protein